MSTCTRGLCTLGQLRSTWAPEARKHGVVIYAPKNAEQIGSMHWQGPGEPHIAVDIALAGRHLDQQRLLNRWHILGDRRV